MRGNCDSLGDCNVSSAVTGNNHATLLRVKPNGLEKTEKDGTKMGKKQVANQPKGIIAKVVKATPEATKTVAKSVVETLTVKPLENQAIERGKVVTIKMREVFFPHRNIAREAERTCKDFSFLQLLFGLMNMGLLSVGVEPLTVVPAPNGKLGDHYVPTGDTWSDGKAKHAVTDAQMFEFAKNFASHKGKKFVAVDGFNRFRAWALSCIALGKLDDNPEISVRVISKADVSIAAKCNNRLATIEATPAETLLSCWDLIPYGETALYTSRDGNPPVLHDKSQASGFYSFGLVAMACGLSREEAFSIASSKDGQRPDQRFRNELNKELGLKDKHVKLAKALLDPDTLADAKIVLYSSRSKSEVEVKAKLPEPASYPVGSLAQKLLIAFKDKDGKAVKELLDKVNSLSTPVKVDLPAKPTRKGKTA